MNRNHREIFIIINTANCTISYNEPVFMIRSHISSKRTGNQKKKKEKLTVSWILRFFSFDQFFIWSPGRMNSIYNYSKFHSRNTSKFAEKKVALNLNDSRIICMNS